MRPIRFPVAVLLALALGAAVAAAAEFRETVRVDGDHLVLRNLVGHVEVVRGGGDFELEIHVRGDDADRGAVRIERDEKDGAQVVMIRYPDDEKTFIYPPMGRGKTTIQFRGQGGGDRGFWDRLRGAIGGERITVKGDGRGFEAWADVTVKVPDGRRADIMLGAGDIEARDVEARLLLDTHSGPVDARKIRGDLTCDTGSGAVSVQDCQGRIHVDTGSGTVRGEDLRGPKVLVDTGSGGVILDGVECEKLDVDTGSGRVEALGVSCDAARIDTGSGSVKLELRRMGGGKYLLDTGSGSVELILPRDASCRVACDTGSGGVTVDVPGVTVEREGRDEARFTVGGGEARVVIDTGSGGIRVRSAS